MTPKSRSQARLSPPDRARLLADSAAAASLAATLALTARFLMSCFPRLERLRLREQPWRALAAATDPALQNPCGALRHERLEVEGWGVEGSVVEVWGQGL